MSVISTDQQLYELFTDGAAAVFALVGTRVYQDVAPQGSALPRVVLQEIDTRGMYTHSGDAGLDDEIYQVSAHGPTPESARAVAAAVREDMRAAVVTTHGSCWMLDGQTKDKTDPIDASDVCVHRVVQTWTRKKQSEE